MTRTVGEYIFDHGEVSIRVYETDTREFVVADQAGWLSGVFDTAEQALDHGKRANNIS